VNAVLDAEGILVEDARKLLKAVASEPGALREMKFVLRSARMIAHEMGEEELSASHIKAAHETRRVEMGGSL
jgi:enoyl-CoA hydratase/carnithine racemase